MPFKQILVILCVLIIIVGGFYFLLSPYQNCLRMVDKKIEALRNKLATETDNYKRENIELEQKELVNQREFGCFERSTW